MAHGDNPEDIYDEGRETEEHEDGWSPDKEKKEDPAKLAREAIELQKEGIAYLRSLRENPPAVVRAYRPPPVPAPTSLTVSIRRISNGYIMAKIPQGVGGYHDPGEPTHYRETFYDSITKLITQIGLEVVDFAASLPGCPTGPAGGAGVEGVETPPGVGSDVPEGT